MFAKDSLLQFDPSPHSPHSIISTLIRENTVILDVGCNTGYLGEKLWEKAVVSDGVDINKKALRIAQKYYRNVYVRDLSSQSLNLKKKYDYIIFADILEHLPQPDRILSESHKYLTRSGRVIISLPNVARFEIRLKLLFGEFDYTPGILGGDHLRFFTRKSASELIGNCGYNVEYTIPTGLGHRIKVFPTLTAFQFIYVCKKM